MGDGGALPRPVTVIVPLRSLGGAKTRLNDVLDPAERAELAMRLLRDVIEAARAWGGADQVMVVSTDPAVGELAKEMGAEAFLQRTSGMNEGLDEARAALDGDRGTLIVLPADLPAVSAAALERLEATALDLERDGKAPTGSDGQAEDRSEEWSMVLVVTDRSGEGTNALLLHPPAVIPFAFGDGSSRAHALAGERAGAAVRTVRDDELSFDVDTPADLERWRRRRGGYRTLVALPVPGIGEITAGDDLGGLIATALQRAAEVDGAYGPLPGDVLVVTQKIVSKAEGRLVELAGVKPRPEAVAWAAAWGRDARQIEVVLRESAEILRMERGVIIARTRHGFVCANAGVDASNVPAGTVSLLPEDPDRTAEELRSILSERFGVPLAIVISDSFGRPWRLGITDVALGMAGFAPLADLRGEPDAGGRIMRTTVIAVADEIASAADLAAGKTSGAPVVLVRGVRLPPEPADTAQRGARGIIMARDQELFR
jgi:coenzyme F420-0:L-glutamate ligase/coenzyme F420-1:gamma-L-glutamate ligase